MALLEHEKVEGTISSRHVDQDEILSLLLIMFVFEHLFDVRVGPCVKITRIKTYAWSKSRDRIHWDTYVSILKLSPRADLSLVVLLSNASSFVIKLLLTQ